MPAVVSRVFMNGNSQAVRIPQELRLNSNRVEITRARNGDLVIHPLTQDPGTALLEALSAFDSEFVTLLEEDRKTSMALQDRDML